MKKRILLIDESLTVQKVMALTLDKGSYQLLYARSRQEVVKTVVDQPVDLIFLSDNVTGLSWQSFPKEMESWLGKTIDIPSVILITGQDIQEAKHFGAVLKKPFSPNQLLQMVETFFEESPGHEPTGETDRQLLPADSLQAAFNRRFADESELARQTLEEDSIEDVEPESRVKIVHSQNPSSKKSKGISASDLWESESSDFEETPEIPGAAKEKTEDLWGTKSSKSSSTSEENFMEHRNAEVLTSEDSLAYKSFLQNEVKSKIQENDLEEMVKKALIELMPPIVEKLVKERLDDLLKEHEESLAS